MEVNAGGDVILGMVVSNVYKIPLTQIPQFHYQYERWPQPVPKDQIVLSYDEKYKHLVGFDDSVFNPVYDPTYFYSVHCYFYPSAKFCPESPSF